MSMNENKAVDPLLFFDNCESPDNLMEIDKQINTFIQHILPNDRIAIVTSGGTTVPLEKNTVRYLDNFSTGRRGAASTEYFLKAGYRVIFLHRRGSKTPFARRIEQSLNCNGFDFSFLLNIALDKDNMKLSNKALDAFKEFQDVQKNNQLMVIEFTTVVEYLFYLRLVATKMSQYKKRVVFYLAAAVSDFYIPDNEMETHKIQSRNGPFELKLIQTPKLLGVLKNKWAPEAFCFSFKLETDEDILLGKARKAIDNYDMNGVIANELHSRNHRLSIVYPRTVIDVALSTESKAHEIEELIVKEIDGAHKVYVES